MNPNEIITTSAGRILVEEWQKADKELKEYPIGTKARAAGGGWWTKTEQGWQWANGSSFPTVGGDWDGYVSVPYKGTTHKAPYTHDELIKEVERLQTVLSRYSNQDVKISNQQKEIDRLTVELKEAQREIARRGTDALQRIKELLHELTYIVDEADEYNGEVFIDIKRLNQLKTLIAKNK